MRFTFRPRALRVLVGLFALFVLSACYVYPDSGRWSGSGSYNDERLSDHRSCRFDLDISHLSGVISVNAFRASCGGFSARLFPGSYTRRGDRIWQGEREVGRVFADGTVELEAYGENLFLRHPLPNSRVLISWTLVGGQLHLSVREGDGPRTRRFDGWLHRES